MAFLRQCVTKDVHALPPPRRGALSGLSDYQVKCKDLWKNFQQEISRKEVWAVGGGWQSGWGMRPWRIRGGGDGGGKDGNRKGIAGDVEPGVRWIEKWTDVSWEETSVRFRRRDSLFWSIANDTYIDNRYYIVITSTTPIIINKIPIAFCLVAFSPKNGKRSPLSRYTSAPPAAPQWSKAVAWADTRREHVQPSPYIKVWIPNQVPEIKCSLVNTV